MIHLEEPIQTIYLLTNRNPYLIPVIPGTLTVIPGSTGDLKQTQ